MENMLCFESETNPSHFGNSAEAVGQFSAKKIWNTGSPWLMTTHSGNQKSDISIPSTTTHTHYFQHLSFSVSLPVPSP